MAKISKINHVAVAVADIESALSFWRDALGIELSHLEDVPSQKSQVAFLPIGDGDIELVKPSMEGTGLAKFLAEKGPGIHHICLEVDDLDEMLINLKTRGVHLLNEFAEILPGRKVAFIHPKAAGGVLVELIQKTN